MIISLFQCAEIGYKPWEYNSACLFYDTHLDTEFTDNDLQKKTGSFKYVRVVHSANYGQKYFTQNYVNIIGYFT